MTPVSYTVCAMVREAFAPGDLPQGGIARAFVLARREARSLPAYPGRPPADLASAYRIQDEALLLDGRAIAGWKVGRIPDPEVAHLGCNRLAGPILVDTLVEGAANVEAPMPAFLGGFIALEAEFMLRLRVPSHATPPVDDAQTREWVDEVRIGIEIASSPYAGINDDGPCVTISDFGNNAGALLGPAVPDWRARDLQAIEVLTEIAGREVGRATASAMLDGPYGAVRFLLDNLQRRGIAPQSGWWISSGAVTGVHVAQVGDRAVANFAGLGSLACRIVAARR
jgi:2-keto-4-pentenoate hydratase